MYVSRKYLTDGSMVELDAEKGVVRRFMDGALHSDGDQPAVFSIIAGTTIQRYYVRGKLHRDGDQPAVIEDMPEGTQKREYWQHGELHRDGNEPAFVHVEAWGTESCAWYRKGLLHRDGDMPAFTRRPAGHHQYMIQQWNVDGNLHRNNGLPSEVGPGSRLTWSWKGYRVCSWIFGERTSQWFGGKPAYLISQRCDPPYFSNLIDGAAFMLPLRRPGGTLHTDQKTAYEATQSCRWEIRKDVVHCGDLPRAVVCFL